MLSDAVNGPVSMPVAGDTVAAALADLFQQKPGLRHHILDDSGAIRPHVSVFVDGRQADLGDGVDDRSQIRVLHAVSGG
jgi:hypothetical protein